jgi:cell division transport system permease protein
VKALWSRLAAPRETPIVPSGGSAGRLVIFSAAAMSFLAVSAAAFGLAADRLADRWSEELAQGATVLVSAPAELMEERIGAALSALRSTPGIASAEPLTDEEQQALLAPWLGAGAPLDALEAPRLIAVVLAGDGPDGADLSRRLEMEAPGAVFDDHARWRAPLARAAGALRMLALGAVLLTALSAAAMVMLAARATLATNRRVVETLRLLGATDAYVARAFVRRYTLRAAFGGAVGAGLASLALTQLPGFGEAGALAAKIGPSGFEWLLIALTPLVCAGVAWLATRLSVAAALKRAA